MSRLPPAIFLMGPTASGKTHVAIELTQRFPVEIISVDSAQVFQDMNIGTAKPDTAILAQAPHHLIDIVAPTETYSAAAFRRDALQLMADITARGKVPLLVGGTMLYFKALREGLSPLPQADAAIRGMLGAEMAKHGIEALHQRLTEVDPATAARLHRTDTQRIQRALEVFLITGQPMSALLQQREQTTLPYRILSLALIPSDRQVLHQRIGERFQGMLDKGLVEELQSLRQRYALQRDMPAMRCVGYRQAWEYLEGEIGKYQLLEKGIAATRQLAKRQMTWLRSMGGVKIDCLATDLHAQVMRQVQTAIT